MLEAAREQFRQRIDRWIDRRQPRADCEELSQRNLYILPAQDGLRFMLLVVLIWLMGTNYENNLILMLAFFLVAVFISAIFATHANLSGLQISLGDVDPVFAGGTLRIPVEVENNSDKPRYRISLSWQREGGRTIDLSPNSKVEAVLDLTAEKRGRIQVPRLQVETRAPLSLLRAWSHPMLRSESVVYPKPVSRESAAYADGEGGEQQSSGRGTDDFSGLESWQPGVPAQRIAWKQFSAGKGLLEKRFAAQSHNPKWLDWEDYAGMDTETRLSAICAKALELENLGRSYGLRIPSAMIPPAQGERHLRQLLTALALHPGDDVDVS